MGGLRVGRRQAGPGHPLRADGGARLVDAVRRALPAGERALTSSGIPLPAVYEASVAALQMFSPATLHDDAAISGWLDIYEMSATRRSAASGQDAGFPMTSSALRGYAPKWPKSSRTETMSR